MVTARLRRTNDAIAAPVWVERLIHCFTRLSPAPAAVGGPIHPIWEAPRPSWLPDSLLGEVFTNQGVGTMVVEDIESLTPAEQAAGHLTEALR